MITQMATVSCVLILFEACSIAAPMSEADYSSSHNLIQNASFESDWMHNRVTSNNRFLLLDQSDWGYAQSDGVPDLWVTSPPAGRSDHSQAKVGSASLRLENGEAWQVVYLCGETTDNNGGSAYNPFRPLSFELQRHVVQSGIRFGGWCKSREAESSPTLSISMEYSNGETITTRQTVVSFPPGTHDWEYHEAIVLPDPKLGIMHAATVRLTQRGKGVAWFDGLLAEEQEKPTEPDLLPGCVSPPLDGEWPADWSRPLLWTWTRRDYYRFTGWSHGEGAMRGGAACINCGPIGQPVLQFSVFPGDNFAVHSTQIRLNQTQPTPLRVTAWVWADSLRWLEIMAQDEKGDWLPQTDFAGAWGTDEQYRNRLIGAGTHGWEFQSKFFAPRHPLKSLTLWLCTRGMDGRLMKNNVVGTVRFHDVQLRECGSSVKQLELRGVVLRAQPEPVRTTDEHKTPRRWIIDPGERLWGRNSLQIATSSRDIPTLTASSYTIREMCRDWSDQRHLPEQGSFFYGTADAPISIRTDSTCVYPGEKLSIGINVNVARESLGEIAICRIVLHSATHESTLLETKDIAANFWKEDQPRPGLLEAGVVSGRQLITLSCDCTELPIRPATDPFREWNIVATLLDTAGKVIGSAASEPFALVARPPAPSLPEKIRQTHISPAGVLLVNGSPFYFRPFPLEKTDLGAVSRLVNFPKTHKTLPLPFPKELTFPAGEDELWKKKVQSFVDRNRGDPKLFAWHFDHNGETMMWFDRWREMAACQRKVADWTRERDPDHVILSAEWLFGTGTLDTNSARQFDFLDELDVEPALSWLPDVNAIRESGHNHANRDICVVEGLECYHYQPLDALRWRMYEAMGYGASDVGICPSNMLAPRPEAVTFLRTLYAEELCLETMLCFGKA